MKWQMHIMDQSDLDYPLIDPGLIPKGWSQSWDEEKKCYVLIDGDNILEYKRNKKILMDEEKKDAIQEDEAEAAGIPVEEEKTEDAPEESLPPVE